MKIVARFIGDTSGATMVEYGVIGAMVCLGLVIGATAVGANINAIFNVLSTTLAPVPP
jgi:pilus assembly protein Flp/PilA